MNNRSGSEEITGRDPLTGRATGGRIGGLEWRLSPEGAITHPDGTAYTSDELRELGNGVEVTYSIDYLIPC